MSENSGKKRPSQSRNCLFCPINSLNPRRYWIYFAVKQRNAANAHIWGNEIREYLAFLPDKWLKQWYWRFLSIDYLFQPQSEWRALLQTFTPVMTMIIIKTLDHFCVCFWQRRNSNKRELDFSLFSPPYIKGFEPSSFPPRSCKNII